MLLVSASSIIQLKIELLKISRIVVIALVILSLLHLVLHLVSSCSASGLNEQHVRVMSCYSHNVVVKCRGGRRLLLSARKLGTVLSGTRYSGLLLSNSYYQSVCVKTLSPPLYRACNN